MNNSLAVTHRPTTFDTIAGQQHWIEALKTRVLKNKLPPVFILAGPSGTGKTTTGLVLAKSLVCLTREDNKYNPCNNCAGCRSVDNSSGANYMYLDGSGTDLANTIRDNLKLMVSTAPVAGARFKVCLIDEFQAFSAAAKSTLLTLFEDVNTKSVIICTTTDPEKIHEALRDRSYEISFRPLTIEEQLNSIYTSNVLLSNYEEEMHQLAKASKGSLRKLWALIDRCDGDFSQSTIDLVIGKGSKQSRLDFINYCLTGKPKMALAVWENWEAQGLNLDNVSQEILEDMIELTDETKPQMFKHIRLLSATLVNRPELFKIMALSLYNG